MEQGSSSSHEFSSSGLPEASGLPFFPSAPQHLGTLTLPGFNSPRLQWIQEIKGQVIGGGQPLND